MSKWSKGEAASLPLWRRLIFRPELLDSREALLKGLGWLIVATMLSWYFRVAPTLTIGFDISGYVALWRCLVEQLLLWSATVVLLYLAMALIDGECNFKELAARTLFARLPIYLLLLPACLGDFRIPFAEYANAPMSAFEDYPSTIAYAVFNVVMVLAYVWWSYRAFVKVRGLDDMRGRVFFVVGIVLACEVSEWLMQLL